MIVIKDVLGLMYKGQECVHELTAKGRFHGHFCVFLVISTGFQPSLEGKDNKTELYLAPLFIL